MCSKNNVSGVIVTYEPNIKALGLLINSLWLQVGSLVIIDNGSSGNLKTWINQWEKINVEIILLIENQGIAAAQNIGIQWALNRGAEFVLLMDQDSVPWPDMVRKLTLGLAQGNRQFNNLVIAAGPTSFDSRTGSESFFVTEQNGIPRRRWVKSSSNLTNTICEVSSLISSGKLINLSLLKIVGGMRSNYFIDHVDTEWCFRAKSQGYVLIGVNNAYMKHTLGDKVKNIWFFGWRRVAYHSPLRDYYMFRNTLLMNHDVRLSILWRIHLLWRLVKFAFYFLIFTPNRLERFNSMSLGVYHGMCGISGKLIVKTKKCIEVHKTSLDPN